MKAQNQREELRNAGVFIVDGIEFIRKDALLKWLVYEKEWFSGTDIEPHYQKVIDKLNSM